MFDILELTQEEGFGSSAHIRQQIFSYFCLDNYTRNKLFDDESNFKKGDQDCQDLFTKDLYKNRICKLLNR